MKNAGWLQCHPAFFFLMDAIDSGLPNAFGTFAAPIGAF